MRRVIWILLAFFLAAPAHAEFGIHGLGTIAGADGFASRAIDVSADGRVVVGSASLITYYDWATIVREQAFRSVNGQMTGFAELLPNHERSIARAVSADGSVVTGQYKFYSGATEVFRWEDGVLTTLGDLAGGATFSRGNGITADGSVIAGYGNNAAETLAVLWEESNPDIIGSGAMFSLAKAISADGSRVVGTEGGGVVWEEGTATALPSLPGAYGDPEVRGISADGSVVVGNVLFGSGNEAVIWVDGVPESLGDLEGGQHESWADDASADGSVVVGTAHTDFGSTAFVWDRLHGLRELKTILEEGGVDLTGWTLHEATGVSDDGLTVVGNGSYYLDDLGFRATLEPTPVAAPQPAPASLLLRVTAVPNPFNPRTRVGFEISRPERVRIDVYDWAGRHLRSLVDGPFLAGPHQVIWNGQDAAGRELSSGSYLVRVRTALESTSLKVTLIK